MCDYNYIINNQGCNKDEIDSLSRTAFSLRYICDEKPLKLFKYFPNIYNLENRNYSLEALQNNTVHLQNPLLFDDPYDSTLLIEPNIFAVKRIRYYAEICKINLNAQWDYFRILFELASYLYSLIDSGKNLEDVFLNGYAETNHLYLRHKRFLENLNQKLIEYSDRNDVWQIAISEAISREFIEAKEFIKSFKVSCFTTNPYSMLMWAHYADYHKGFCIEYEIPNYCKENAHIFNNLFPVIYSKERTSVLPYCINALTNKSLSDDDLWNMYKYGLLTKSLDWKYQDEWRLIWLSIFQM